MGQILPGRCRSYEVYGIYCWKVKPEQEVSILPGLGIKRRYYQDEWRKHNQTQDGESIAC